MKKLRLYLETSVWNFYFADDAPEKREITREFFQNVDRGNYEIVISEIVLKEIGQASDKKHSMLSELIQQYQPHELEITEEILTLAQKYIDEDVLPQRAIDDSIHAAVASVYEVDALISWNLRHLANLRKMEQINGINLKEGYSKRVEIITPLEVSVDET